MKLTGELHKPELALVCYNYGVVTGKIFSNELGIDLKSGKEADIFHWFLACLLFGKPIQQDVARRAYEVLVKSGVDTPDKILTAGWDKLVKLLDEGHYVRFDYSTATKLLNVCQKLQDDYGGKVTNIKKQARDKQDLVRRLLEFKGIGPKTAEIFLRDMDKVWYQK